MPHLGSHAPDPWLSFLKDKAKCLQPRCFSRDMSGAQHEVGWRGAYPDFLKSAKSVYLHFVCLPKEKMNSVPFLSTLS